jgi:hypothetical protein
VAPSFATSFAGPKAKDAKAGNGLFTSPAKPLKVRLKELDGDGMGMNSDELGGILPYFNIFYPFLAQAVW